MSLFRQAMEVYPYVAHPITVVGAGYLAAIYYEWRRRSGEDDALQPRLLAFAGAGALALLPTVVYFTVVGGGILEATRGKSFAMDALVAGGLFLVAGATWAVWRRREWGPVVPSMSVTLAAVTVPYVALSPVWDFSGHVTLALMPTLYLTLVDRRFWPTLAVPLVMVPNRVIVNAHTWAQSVAAFVVTAAVVVAVYRLRSDEIAAGRGRATAW